jgi:hypothetical protein
MSTHRPIYPSFVRLWALRRYGERYHISWENVRTWQQYNPEFELTNDLRPMPWWLQPRALGVFVKPWNKIASWFIRQTGEFSHRCEFTDKEDGLLYGGKKGAFMNKMFEQFIESIDDEEGKANNDL